MNPISINLVAKKNVWGTFVLFLFAGIVSITFGITCVTAYDYFANKRVVKEYETRLDVLKRQVKIKKEIIQKRPLVNESQLKKQDAYLDFIVPIIEKKIFSIPAVLSEIEKKKPNKITINTLVFSKDNKTVIIEGESKYISAISDFIINMKQSDQFDVDLTNEEFDTDKTVFFELTALWKPYE